MSTLWTFAAVCDALVTAVSALPALTALDPLPQVRVSIPSFEEGVSECLVFGYAAEDQSKELVAMGAHGHQETVTVSAFAEVIRSGGGDTEAKAARDRAILLVSIVDTYLRLNDIQVGTETLRMQVGIRDFVGFPHQAGEPATTVRVARVPFDIDYTARTDP